MTRDTDLILRALVEMFGERCPDFDPDCVGCQAWAEFDRLTARPVQESPSPQLGKEVMPDGSNRAATAPSPGVTAGANDWRSVLKHYRDVYCEGFCEEAEWADAGHSHPDMQRDCGGCRAAAALLANPTPAPVVPAEGLADYDAGLLNDFGGGNVEWWQDYLRAEIGRANEHWRVQAQDLCERRAAMLGDFAERTADDITALRSAPPVGARVSIPFGLIDALRSQRQIDADGCEVAVSRQACDEAAAILAALLPAGEGE